MVINFKLDWHEVFIILVFLSMLILAIRNKWISGKAYIKLRNKASIVKIILGLISVLMGISEIIYIFTSNNNSEFFISISGWILTFYLIFTGITMPRLCESGILTSMNLIQWSKIKSVEWKGSFWKSISIKDLFRGRFTRKNLADAEKNLLVIHTEEVSALGIDNQIYKVIIPLNKKGTANEIIKSKLILEVNT